MVSRKVPAAAAAALLFMLLTAVPSSAGCQPTLVTPNTPTGIAGCEKFGRGIASHYGPGNGVAMNFCTWALRHSSGCGWVTITSLDTGRSATVPVIDFCDCYTGTRDERLVDLQYGVVGTLGLDLAQGLYRVEVTRPRKATAPRVVPDTALTVR